MSIGDEVYLTLAKGGIIPEHFIIIPIEHHGGTIGLQDSVVSEMRSLLSSMRVFEDKDFLLFCHRQNPAHHLHIQVIAIPKERVTECMSFVKEFSSSKGFTLDPASWDSFKSDSHSFICGTEGDLVQYSIEEGAFFPTSFGRELVANFLHLTDRLDWKLSPLTEDEERQLVGKFKSLMKL